MCRLLRALAAAIVFMSLFPAVAPAAPTQRPPRIVRAVIKDPDSAGRPDRLVLTYSKKINHPRDASGLYAFRVSGQQIRKIERSYRSRRLVIQLKQTPAETVSPPIIYYRRNKNGPRDLQGNLAVDQDFTDVDGDLILETAIKLVRKLVDPVTGGPTPTPEPEPTLEPEPEPEPEPTPEPTPGPEPTPEPEPTPTSDAGPPPASGYSALQAPGFQPRTTLEVAPFIHRTSWEPRATNADAWDTSVQPDKSRFFCESGNTYNSTTLETCNWLHTHVTSDFEGVSTEAAEWAALKWGVSDDMVRAVMHVEATWYQKELYQGVYPWRGFGDFTSDATRCAAPYPLQYNPVTSYEGEDCPLSFGITQIKHTVFPGTFPASTENVAFSLDLYGWHLRTCINGGSWFRKYESYRQAVADAEASKTALEELAWDCAASWYSGRWRDASGDAYEQRMRDSAASDPWLSY